MILRSFNGLSARERKLFRLGALLASTALCAGVGGVALADDAAQGASPVVAAAAVAQVPPAGDAVAAAATMNQVTVTADSYANSKTIATKRDLGVVSDGISANEIGELPEFGLGDALSSVPGVTFVINNGRGEDQFMTIRGLNPDYNSVTVDGMVLPSTEETTRSVSFDVLPSVLVSQANVLKTWTVDQPSDAVGGVTDLRTRSAFDHPGTFVSGHLDGAWWEDDRKLHSDVPSGQGDLVMSRTFGPNNEFGALILGSYYQRSSNTLNTYTLPYSYYPTSGIGQNNVSALDQTSATASSTTLKPGQDVDGMIPIPDRHRWYFYDNVRSRPGAFTRFDFDDHHMWHAHLSGGLFRFTNNENRYSQYLNRVGPADITSATTGSFAQGQGEADYDHYVQTRQLAYIDAGVGADFGPKTHLNFTVNYAEGHYRQTTAEDQFLTSTSSNYAFDYNLAAQTSALFTPQNQGAFMNPANYNQVYHLNAVDESFTKVPQEKLEFTHNFDLADRGFGFSMGAQHRDLSQTYLYNQDRLNPVAGAVPTLGQIGTLSKPIAPFNGEGQDILLVNPNAVDAYIAANPNTYVRNASDLLSNTVNNYTLHETIDDGFVQAGWRSDRLYALFGLRYEATGQKIENFLPVPFNSQTNFAQSTTNSDYARLLPSFNLTYSPVDPLVLRGAITRTLARPEYAQLAQNSSASVSGNLATETISNPHLAPRESTNFDISAEYYPAPYALASVALFRKDISNEIVTETSTQQGVMVPGFAQPVTLTTTTPENAGKAKVEGVELNLVDSRFTFLPGVLKGLGARGNIAFMSMDAPYIRMSDGTFRHLPQLISAARSVANAAIMYNYGPFASEVSYNHTGKQPISFDTNNAVNDQWWSAIDTIDAQVRYAVTRNLEFRVQVKNLGDNAPQKVVGPNQGLNYSSLENGRAYFAGIGFHY